MSYADIGLQVLIGLDDEGYVPRADRTLRQDPNDPNNWLGGGGQNRITGEAQVTGAPNGLRLRDAPVSGNTLISIPEGTVVGIGEGKPGWPYVTYAGHYGYASADYLKPVGGPAHDYRPPDPVPPPQPAPVYIPPPAPTPVKPVEPPPPPPEPELSLGTKIMYAALIAGAVVLPAWLLTKKGSGGKAVAASY
jgi:hypothetical protein